MRGVFSAGQGYNSVRYALIFDISDATRPYDHA